MLTNTSEYAMIKISVTTTSGAVPIAGATVTVSYNTVPGMNAIEKQIMKTDKNGNTEIFKMPIKRAIIGDRRVDFPRRAECNVEIKAEGYVTTRARAVHLFPDVTVMSSFDLIPSTTFNKLEA